MTDFGWRKMLGGSGGGRFRTATPFGVRSNIHRAVVVEAAEPPVGMSGAADPAISYGASASPLQFSTFNNLGGVTSSGPDYTTFTFSPGHVSGTVAVHFSGDGTGTLTVTSTGGSGPWATTSAGDIIVNVDETSGSAFDLTATLSYDAGGTQTLSSGAANLFYV